MDIFSHPLGIDVIVQELLKNLSYVELLKVQGVCKLWQYHRQHILTSRNKLLFSSSQHHTIDTSLESTPKSKRIKLLASIELRKQKYLAAFIEWRNTWAIIPDTIFLICTLPQMDFSHSYTIFDESNLIHSLVQKIIPDACTLVILTNTAVLDDGNRVANSEHSFNFNGWAVSFPQQVTTSFFTWPSFVKRREKMALIKNLECQLQKQTDLKLLILFIDVENVVDNDWIVNELLPEIKEKVFTQRKACIFGAILDDSIAHIVPRNSEGSNPTALHQNQQYYSFLSYMISGKDVSVSSIVLQCQSCDHEIDEEFHKLVDEKLSRLKQSVGHKKVILKFVVSCCSQQGNLKTVDKEINGKVNKYTPMDYAFDDKFPNVPTLSLIGTGEIGFDYNLIGEQMPIDRINQECCSIFTVVS